MRKPLSIDTRTLGQNLHFFCNVNKLNIYELADFLQYNRVALGQLLLGERNIKLSTANRIAMRTGYTLSALLSNLFIDDKEYRQSSIFREINTYAIFLKNFNYLISKNNISQAQLAENLEMDKAQLSKLLAGEVKDPTLETLSKLSRAAGRNLSDLFKEDFN